MKVEEIHPYSGSTDKGKEVEEMFDAISPRYDFMNSAMSLGQHRRWRDKALKAALREIKNDNPKIIDIATGTGDVAFRLNQLLPEACITGIDLSEGMLEIARRKLESLPLKQREQIAFGKGDSLALPFHDGEFQIATVAYGVRNFSNLRKGLEEIRRVVVTGGVLCIIELSIPTGFITKSAYNIYAGKIIPWLGRKVTGDPRAYSYLPESIRACPQRNDMAALLKASGFSQVSWQSLSFGALTYYIAK